MISNEIRCRNTPNGSANVARLSLTLNIESFGFREFLKDYLKAILI